MPLSQVVQRLPGSVQIAETNKLGIRLGPNAARPIIAVLIQTIKIATKGKDLPRRLGNNSGLQLRDRAIRRARGFVKMHKQGGGWFRRRKWSKRLNALQPAKDWPENNVPVPVAEQGDRATQISNLFKTIRGLNHLSWFKRHGLGQGGVGIRWWYLRGLSW